MVVNIDMNSQVPIYEQLKEQVMYGVLTGRIHEGEQLPSIRQLSSDLGINMHTVTKVYKILENEGFVVINKKKGVFIHTDFSKLGINYSNDNLLREIELKTMLYKKINNDTEAIKEIIRKMEVLTDE